MRCHFGFCEGRKQSTLDYGEIEIVLKRSLGNRCLLIPCDHFGNGCYSDAIQSDDQSASWTTGSNVPDRGTNKSIAIQTTDAFVYLNIRNKHLAHQPLDRFFSTSGK